MTITSMTITSMTIRHSCVALCTAVGIFAGGALAQSYPNQPIRLVVPFAPGGSTDVVARLVAEAVATRLGKPVIVDNKPGGGANIGTTFVARAKPDGYTLLLATPTQTINSTLYRNPPFDLKKDFTAVGMVGSSPIVLLAGMSVPAKNITELIALAKSRPGKMTFASGGVASTGHLAGEVFARAAGLDLHHIPYKGAAPAMNDVIGGQVDMVFGFISSAAPLIKAGRVRALAVAGQRRLPELPDVPTLAEIGVKGVDVDGWYGILAPAGTPDDVLARLNREMTASLAVLTPRLADMGILPAQPTQTYFAEWLDRESRMWARVIRESNTPLLD